MQKYSRFHDRSRVGLQAPKKWVCPNNFSDVLKILERYNYEYRLVQLVQVRHRCSWTNLLTNVRSRLKIFSKKPSCEIYTLVPRDKWLLTTRMNLELLVRAQIIFITLSETHFRKIWLFDNIISEMSLYGGGNKDCSVRWSGRWQNVTHFKYRDRKI